MGPQYSPVPEINKDNEPQQDYPPPHERHPIAPPSSFFYGNYYGDDKHGPRGDKNCHLIPVQNEQLESLVQPLLGCLLIARRIWPCRFRVWMLERKADQHPTEEKDYAADDHKDQGYSPQDVAAGRMLAFRRRHSQPRPFLPGWKKQAVPVRFIICIVYLVPGRDDRSTASSRLRGSRCWLLFLLLDLL